MTVFAVVMMEQRGEGQKGEEQLMMKHQKREEQLGEDEKEGNHKEKGNTPHQVEGGQQQRTAADLAFQEGVAPQVERAYQEGVAPQVGAAPQVGRAYQVGVASQEGEAYQGEEGSTSKEAEPRVVLEEVASSSPGQQWLHYLATLKHLTVPLLLSLVQYVSKGAGPLGISLISWSRWRVGQTRLDVHLQVPSSSCG